MYLNENTKQAVLLILLLAIGLIFVLICAIVIIYFHKRRPVWSETSVLSMGNEDSMCYNDGFDCVDETSASRIEERRRARKLALQNYPPNVDLSLKKLDPEVGKALAVEQLMQDSYVFDTRILAKPSGDVEVVAAKRDYL
ncbi:unnamed protein product [Caenorhabditis auriculariae]|uniref:Uncharacterized protein n=1 Tax=Caenorhabditis auriculariae TaxID=2777116 RepID=A0A8S1H9K2_9PELO|nr:unnamed protein product [Caenorhabditis auriculariae]